jgi:hypothetical protein
VVLAALLVHGHLHVVGAAEQGALAHVVHGRKAVGQYGDGDEEGWYVSEGLQRSKTTKKEN